MHQATSSWFSTNPDKAWAERFFLWYSPIWMLLMALMMVTGWQASFSNAALLIHSAVVALPLMLIPLWLRRHSGVIWWQSYWFKANLFLWIFGFFGNYVGSEYFFDVLGMVYRFPNATTTLDAHLVGSGEQSVPVIMYAYTQAYFMTYHITAVLVIRRLMALQLPGGKAWFLPLALLIGYAWAWLETSAMANPLMADSFYYENMAAMLAYGSAIYATYFIVSFPIFYFIDESAHRPWSIFTVCSAALSASMLVFFLLDGTAWLVGNL